MRYLNAYNPSPQAEQTPNSIDYASLVTALATQLNSLQTQMEIVCSRVDQLEVDHMRPVTRLFRSPVTEQTRYSPIVTLSFGAMKWLFLFLAGFAIACILAASFQAPIGVLGVLQLILKHCFLPLVAVTFAIVAITVVLESLK